MSPTRKRSSRLPRATLSTRGQNWLHNRTAEDIGKLAIEVYSLHMADSSCTVRANTDCTWCMRSDGEEYQADRFQGDLRRLFS